MNAPVRIRRPGDARKRAAADRLVRLTHLAEADRLVRLIRQVDDVVIWSADGAYAMSIPADQAERIVRRNPVGLVGNHMPALRLLSLHRRAS